MSKDQRRFDVGAEVMAKWPQSNLYFKAKIIDHNDQEYLVRFYDEGESEYPIKFRNVNVPFSRQSRSRSRGRSPSRTKPKKSPARKSPARKSPARKSPVRKSPPKTVVSEKTVLTSSSVSLRGRPAKIAAEKLIISSNSSRRQSARIADKTSPKTGISAKLNEVFTLIRGRNKFYTFCQRTAIGAWVTLCALIVPAIILFTPFILSLICTAKSCSFTWVEFPQKLSSYYDQKAVTYTAGCLFLIFLLSLLPVGKVFIPKNGNQVRCNGYVTLVVLTAIAIGVLRMQYNVSSAYLLFRHILVSSSFFAILLSVLLYVKSFFIPKSNLNPKGNTGYYLVDFVVGREINPKIGSIDVKFLIYRITLCLCVILNFLVVAKDLQAKHGQYSPTLLVCTGLQIFWAVDHLIFEDSFFSTFDYLKTGTGFISVYGYIITPFLITVYSRFILNHGTELPWYYLLSIVTLNLTAFTIFRGSTSQRHAFKVNPNDPALVHLESLPAASGKRLLVSGWFGRIRHPNILGEILGEISLASLCGCTIYVPYIVTLLLVTCSLARMIMDEKASKNEYGLAWNNYVSRVPYRLIPKVF